jgi:peptidoglycan endopeptidase LytF
MQKYYILAAVAAFLNISSASASNLRDSIGVENLKGKKVILHKVVQHDTYYSIGRLYNVQPKEIITFNDNKYLQIGVIIKVPTNIPFKDQISTAAKNPPANTSSDNGNYTEYTIQPKDNLNRLAERFGTTVNEIKRINDLNSIHLRIGQVLKMPAQAGSEQQPEQKQEQKQEQRPAQTAANEPIFPSKRPEAVKSTDATVGENGAYIEHIVKAKENLGMLADKYGTTIEEIKKLNGLNSSNLRIAQVLKIPAKQGQNPETSNAGQPVVTETTQTGQKKTGLDKKTQPLQSPADTSAQEEFIEHTVASNETLYSIATKYGLTMDQVKAKNNLPDASLRIGQKLLIKGQYPVKKPYTPPVTDSDAETDSVSTIKNPSLKYAPSRYGLNQIDEKGTAVWIAEEGLDPSKMLVLHRTAPIGTVIKITNPMSNRSTFAKVVGKFTENESTKDVIIVMTKAVADALGALDKRFFCNLTYSGQDTNEQ